MKKDKSGVQNPLILKYLKKYKEDPESVIFAPLAEAYRKEGLIEEAIEICKDGLSIHPELPSGRVTLAKCYRDLRKFKPIVTLLNPIVEQYPENIVALELYGDANLETSRFQQAYDTYHQLFRLLPGRSDVAEKIQNLQAEFNLEQKSPEPDELSQVSEEIPAPPVEPETKELTPHTLVDLYVSQGKLDLARSVLGHILNFDPDDTVAQDKLTHLAKEENIDSQLQVLEKLLEKVLMVREKRQGQ